MENKKRTFEQKQDAIAVCDAIACELAERLKTANEYERLGLILAKEICAKVAIDIITGDK